MRIMYKGKLTFITPCFCAGADQNKPEIRASSIRGQLRWWFRILGGTKTQEASVWGGVAPLAISSKVTVRVSDFDCKEDPDIKLQRISPEEYLYYFATKSGNDVGVYRTQKGHFIGTKSSFNLEIILRKELQPDELSLLEKAINYFLVLGSLGLRATRGCGCFTAEGKSINDLNYEDNNVLIRKVSGDVFVSGKEAQLHLGAKLKEFRRNKNLNGKVPSALGFSSGRLRESSALKLRPVEVDGKFLPYIYYSDAACSQKSILDLLENF